jgi:hypothetical protein
VYRSSAGLRAINPSFTATGQPGFDIDSYDKPPEEPSRLVVRRIEVKGHGNECVEDETVELSDRQFLDAVKRKTYDAAVAPDFDYWLYVVELQADGSLHVLPIKNPSLSAAKFEFRAGTWRALAEPSTPSEGHGQENHET